MYLSISISLYFSFITIIMNNKWSSDFGVCLFVTGRALNSLSKRIIWIFKATFFSFDPSWFSRNQLISSIPDNFKSMRTNWVRLFQFNPIKKEDARRKDKVSASRSFVSGSSGCRTPTTSCRVTAGGKSGKFEIRNKEERKTDRQTDRQTETEKERAKMQLIETIQSESRRSWHQIITELNHWKLMLFHGGWCRSKLINSVSYRNMDQVWWRWNPFWLVLQLKWKRRVAVETGRPGPSISFWIQMKWKKRSNGIQSNELKRNELRKREPRRRWWLSVITHHISRCPSAAVFLHASSAFHLHSSLVFVWVILPLHQSCKWDSRRSLAGWHISWWRSQFTCHQRHPTSALIEYEFMVNIAARKTGR